jgi:hypothetical protein
VIVDATQLSGALRDAIASGRQRIIAVARGGVFQARALARRFPFLDIRVVALDDESIARTIAARVPAGCDGIVVPGNPRLARLVADRAGCRWSAGTAERLTHFDVHRPCVLGGNLLNLPEVRALVSSRVPPATVRIDPSTAARQSVARLPALQERMSRDLAPGFGEVDAPADVLQPSNGWQGRACPDLRTAQVLQRNLVAAGVIAQRQGRILRLPADCTEVGEACPPPPPGPPPPPPLSLMLRTPADAQAAALLASITAAMQRGVRCIVVQPLADDLRDHDDLVEDLRLLARRCPFLDLHLAEAVKITERAALLAPRLGRSVRLCGADRGGLAVLAERLAELGIEADPACGENAWDADDWNDPASLELLADRRLAALADRSLMPDPWQEVAQDLTQGEAHHGGLGGEAVSATGLAMGRVGAMAAADASLEADLASAPISPQAALLVEPVPAAEAQAQHDQQTTVLATLSRGLHLLTGLPVVESPVPGWIGIRVPDPIFMLRAVVVQGILSRRRGDVLWLPAGPAFAMRREIRSVLTAVAKAVVALGELRAQPPLISR